MNGPWRRALLLLAVAASVGACGPGVSGPPHAEPTRHPTPASSTMTEPTAASADAATRAAVTAYLAMWDDFAAAAATSDWRSPKLGQYATGLALSTLSRGLYADHASGVISKGNPTHHILESSVDSARNPRTVMVTDCSDSTHALKFNARTGQPANDSPGGRRLIVATVRRQSDRSWKVVDFGVHEVGTC